VPKRVSWEAVGRDCSALTTTIDAAEAQTALDLKDLEARGAVVADERADVDCKKAATKQKRVEIELEQRRIAITPANTANVVAALPPLRLGRWEKCVHTLDRFGVRQ
jgi:hypothetical protein